MGKRRDDYDKPVKQRLRVVTLIDLVSGWAEVENGDPISIMTLAHLGELEQPLMLTFEDTKLLDGQGVRVAGQLRQRTRRRTARQILYPS
jgi:hypothetical protein